MPLLRARDAKGMDGYAAGIYFQFVDRYREQLSELRAEAAELDRRVVEAWFQCLAFTDDENFTDDLREARGERDETERRHAASLAAIARAAQRLARFERTLQSLTTGPRPEA
jgi:hypothetical protein